MNEEEIAHQQAMVLFDRAYRHQQRGELGIAIQLYQRSLALEATAEAHTFLGWSYSMLGRYEDAIAECHRAIELDPGFGNPYNDIGVYLMELERPDEAVAWLEKAMAAPRYEAPQFPPTNLGRAYEDLGDLMEALRWYRRALQIDPLYLPAEWAKNQLLGQLN